MAIVVEENSICPICRNLLDDSQEYMLTPPMITNKKDDLFHFSDTGMHTGCINNSEIKDRLLYHIGEYDKHIPFSQSLCIVDGKLISEPGKILYFGLLTSDESEELYQFNYLILNIDNVRDWCDYSRFITVAEECLFGGKWEGLNGFDFLKFVVEKLKRSYPGGRGGMSISESDVNSGF